MSNKTTMILTFIVSVVVPFIQEVVDLIEALKGKASSNTVTAKKLLRTFKPMFHNLLSQLLIRMILKKLAVFSVLGGMLNETTSLI